MYLDEIQMPCGRSTQALCKGPVAEVVPALSAEPQGGQSGWSRESYARRSEWKRERTNYATHLRPF